MWDGEQAGEGIGKVKVGLDGHEKAGRWKIEKINSKRLPTYTVWFK